MGKSACQFEKFLQQMPNVLNNKVHPQFGQVLCEAQSLGAWVLWNILTTSLGCLSTTRRWVVWVIESNVWGANLVSSHV